MLMDYNISSLYAFNIGGQTITSINETLPLILQNALPEMAGLVEEGSQTLVLVYELVSMVLRLVVLVIWLILMSTIFKFIFDYLFIY